MPVWPGRRIRAAPLVREASLLSIPEQPNRSSSVFSPQRTAPCESITLTERTDSVALLPPESRPGPLRYRVHGPYRPEHGHRSTRQLLAIPTPSRSWAAHLERRALRLRVGRTGRTFRSIPRFCVGMPRAASSLLRSHGRGSPAQHSWHERSSTASLQRFTARHPPCRPHFAGPMPVWRRRRIDHLVRLGITAVRMLPVHASRRRYSSRKAAQYWGYNSIGYSRRKGRTVGATLRIQDMCKRHSSGIG